MSPAHTIALACAAAGAGALVAFVVRGGNAESDSGGSSHARDPRATVRTVAKPAPVQRSPRASAAGIFLPRGSSRTLITIRGFGKFRVRCQPDQTLRGSFTSTSPDTQIVAIERDGMTPTSNFVNPGKSLDIPAGSGSTTTQRWQFTDITEASSAVALAFIASTPEYVGGTGCEVSAYVLGPTDSRAGG
jgi:hypothetical protein